MVSPSAAGVKIRERVEEIRFRGFVSTENSLHRVDWKILGQGIFVGSTLFLVVSHFPSLSLSLFRYGRMADAVAGKV